MRVAVFSTKPYDEEYLSAANTGHALVFHEARLTIQTAPLADGFDGVCVFANDDLSEPVLKRLAGAGVSLVALRCAGFNHVDVAAAHRAGIAVARVPAYSPNAVAEHTVALILALNRHIPRAYNRVRELNFSLAGLLGFDLCERTVGVVGGGAIGTVFCRIMVGFGCRVLVCDPIEHSELTTLGVTYVDRARLLKESDIISLHCPLTADTHHLINDDALAAMRDGVMLINTGRGALIDTAAIIRALKTGKIGWLGLDVYEEEADLFFEDRSDDVLDDDVFARLLTFPNVLITGHQAFFTREALERIAHTTITNLTAHETGSDGINLASLP